MMSSSEPPRDWKEALTDRVWARWRLLLLAVVLLFVLNNVAGLAAGALGLIAFASRISGRLLRARRMVQEVRQIVADSPDE
jgi:FtsH-binding integral membrane protein